MSESRSTSHFCKIFSLVEVRFINCLLIVKTLTTNFIFRKMPSTRIEDLFGFHLP